MDGADENKYHVRKRPVAIATQSEIETRAVGSSFTMPEGRPARTDLLQTTIADVVMTDTIDRIAFKVCVMMSPRRLSPCRDPITERGIALPRSGQQHNRMAPLICSTQATAALKYVK